MVNAARHIAYLLIGIGGAGGLIALVVTADRTLKPAVEFDPLMPALVVLGFAVMVLGAALRSRAAAQAALAAALCIIGAALLAAGLWARWPVNVSSLSDSMPSQVRTVEIVVGLICLVGGVTEFVRSPIVKSLPRPRLKR